MYKHQVSSYICQCNIDNLVLLALALQPTSVLLLPFQSSPIISSHISFIFHHLRSCSRLSFSLVNSFQADPVSFLPPSSQAHPASIARLSLRCIESHTRQSPVLNFSLIFRHSQPRSSRVLLLCLLSLSSQPTPGSIQFFDSFSSHSQPCLFSFHCLPYAAISRQLDPSSVTLPSFQTSVVSSFFPWHILPGLP